ncbi:hypothetical protein GCM10027082_24290 [Comamonas humi]
MHHTETALDLSTATNQELEAINSRAKKDGVSFDEAAKRMLLEHAAQLRAKGRLNPVAKLFRFWTDNKE